MARRKASTPLSPRLVMPNAVHSPVRDQPILKPRIRMVIVKRPVRVQTPLQLVEDRRRWHPLRTLAPAGTFSRRDQRRLVEAPRQNPYRDPFPSYKIGFAVPKKVAVCVRRKTRREVIHAIGKTGAGARSRRRKSTFTEIRC